MLMSGSVFFNSSLYEARGKSFYFQNTEVKQTACGTRTFSQLHPNLSSFRLEFFSQLHVQSSPALSELCLLISACQYSRFLEGALELPIPADLNELQGLNLALPNLKLDPQFSLSSALLFVLANEMPGSC